MIDERLINAGRVLHDVGLALSVGGNVFGKFALNPAIEKVSRPRERGAVMNRAWGGYAPLNTGGALAAAAGWAIARKTETAGPRLTGYERALARVKDALVAGTLVTNVVNVVQGARLAAQARNGAVPVRSGTRPLRGRTGAKAAGLQRSIGTVGNVNIALGLGTVVVNALLSQANYSRPPLRRSLLRRSR